MLSQFGPHNAAAY